MSFQAKLEIDDAIHNLLDCSFDFDQPLDHNGRPAAAPRGGIIVLTIEFEKKTDLIHWAISPTETKNGQITFMKRDAMASLMTLKFSNAYCARLSGYYNAISNDPFKLKLKISAEKLTIGDVEHINNWPSKV
ncbi:type VI secretion system tube protein TssD [uncultured Aquimarina sp.]|uniref:type VI secretion system tube protein TssD n=1 Tax=uncultured Aquimarina sp. TaxID=575652 RepID=UPI00261B23B4|nr:type VI secretion system tube protein TssD [uncultured Aquimarina sp.]